MSYTEGELVLRFSLLLDDEKKKKKFLTFFRVFLHTPQA